MAVNGVLAGAIALFDPLKPEARGVVAALQQRGIKCHLVTGDNRRTARAIAARLAITSVTAECLPAGKAAVVKVRGCLLHPMPNRFCTCLLCRDTAATCRSFCSALVGADCCLSPFLSYPVRS